MSKVLVTESHLNNIAEAIRSKNGAATTYRPGDMAAAIEALDTSGIHPTGTKNINQNGTHDVTQYANANVNVPNSYAAGDEGKVVSNGALVAQTSRNIAANGTYDTTTNDGVVVSVAPNLQSKTVTENGTVTPDQGYDGLSSVVVNVSGGGGGVSKTLIMSQGQVSTTSAYRSAYFDSGVDLSQYKVVECHLFKNGVEIGVNCLSIAQGTDYSQSFIYGDLKYTMRLSSAYISCSQYSGSYVDLYVDVYGINY